MEVETKNASLDTLAVTIQALHVSGKQMTLAVFRQLPIAEAYSPSGALTPMDRWGLVRYEIKAQGEVWLVGSRDGRLFRCSINLYPAFELLERAQKDAAREQLELDEYVAWRAAVAADQSNRDAFAEKRKRAESDCPIKYDSATSNYLEISRWVSERTGDSPVSTAPRVPHTWKDGMLSSFESSAVAAKVNLALSITADASLKQLLELPQLFIAV